MNANGITPCLWLHPSPHSPALKAVEQVFEIGCSCKAHSKRTGALAAIGRLAEQAAMTAR